MLRQTKQSVLAQRINHHPNDHDGLAIAPANESARSVAEGAVTRPTGRHLIYDWHIFIMALKTAKLPY
ncbi:hypothetical protein [Methylotuvimicrobium sp. KM1]|uniref:hypothetical protein n=1 Tax=Methylotuvimicrobium sp. KM1 TaxID=3377707 RepID=UPI00384DA0B9